MLYPLKFKPVYKDYIWGGGQLKTFFGRNTPGERIAESWDVACHKNGMSIVSNGALAGKSLQEIFDDNKVALIGKSADKYEKFPLLIKLIDAKDKLSIQVHPEDGYAMLHENGEYGKNEMWYVIKAREGAKLAVGIKDGVTKEAFAKGIEEGTLADYINEIPVKAGDVINIPAGLLHAIEDGIMIAEVQQNSDTVYRVFDWNRVGTDGKPRQLHVEQALDVIDFDNKIKKDKCVGEGETKVGALLTKYIYNGYFGVDVLDLEGNYDDTTQEDHMVIIMCLEGTMTVEWQGTTTKAVAGETILIPAELGNFRIEGEGKLLRAFLPTALTDEQCTPRG